MNQQLELSIVENIRRTFSEAHELAAQASEKGRAAILKARECGQYLKEAKQNVGHGRWLSWLSNSNHGWNISDETARKWMKLADIPIEALESIQSLKQAYLALGILPTNEREPGSQTAHPEGQRWLSSILKAWENLSVTIERKPIADWPDSQRVTLKEKLRPMAELYQRL